MPNSLKEEVMYIRHIRKPYLKYASDANKSYVLKH